jgi:hypothetical protein
MKSFTVSLVALVLAAPLAAQSVHVCVAADRTMRVEAGPSCPAGQTGLNLLLAGGGGPPPPGQDQSLIAQLNDAKKSIDFLRDRVSNLEKELAKQKDMKDMQDEHVLTAPLLVVDKSGKPIFTVTDAAFGQATIGRVHIGRGSGSNYGIWVRNAAGGAVAAMGESKAGGGAVNVNDASGVLRAELSGDGFQYKNSAGKDVVGIGLQTTNTAKSILTVTGLFQIIDEAGQKTVEAGTNSKGAGVVVVGPSYKCVPLGTLRVPDCIMGHP